MLRGSNKSSDEIRFELLSWGVALLAFAITWVLFRESLPGLMLFIPGLIILGSAIFQDMQPDWKAGWLTYALAILVVATGLAGTVNTLMGDVLHIKWGIVALVELGAVLVAKALYDPSLGQE